MGVNLFFNLIIFILGLTVGSFLNCVIYRLEKDESFLRGRSYCPNCKHKLSWQDLIPILSFLELQGKCRYCKKPISLHYPLVELATGTLFVGVFHITFPNFLLSTFYFIISSFLIIIFVYDLKQYIIPDEIIFPVIGIAFLYNILYSYFIVHTSHFILNTFYSALGASLFFLAIFLISRGKWLGFGDVKLAFFMGLFLGFPNILVALFLAFFIGAIIGLGLILKKKKTLKSEVPFGPFLVAGTFIALFFGNQIINWYLNLFQIAF
jgi:prepilin signal peptidase PulO-like enzyme (type II secretory pathway)